jgi:sialic acid synthase SpsE
MSDRLAISDNEIYFIAEIGLNHNGSPHLARNLVDLAISSGCRCAKFQKRTIGHMFVNSILDGPFDRFPELGSTMRDVREGLELNLDTYRDLREYCRGKIDFMVTPFDIPSIEFLDKVDIDSFKIASHSATDIPMLREVAKRGKPVVASVGMANEREIQRMVDIFKDVDFTLLHCVSSYPTQSKDANLGVIDWLRHFGADRVGYSDHEDGITMAPIAVALGAEVIEKHITLDKKLQGFDHAMSIEPGQLIQVVRILNEVKRAIRPVDHKEVMPCEVNVFDDRRGSIYANRNIAKGETITDDMIMVKAPLRGLTPRFFERVVGGKALYDLNLDDPITFGVVELKT